MGIEVREDLTVAIGGAAVRLTPGEGFRLAEQLIRRSTARMVEEEVEAAERSDRRPGNGGAQ
jgi:hypothetical protein